MTSMVTVITMVTVATAPTVATMAIEKLNAPIFANMGCLVYAHCANNAQATKTKNKSTTGLKANNEPKFEGWEHKLVVDKYLGNLKTHNEDTTV